VSRGIVVGCAALAFAASAAEPAKDGRGIPFRDDLVSHLEGAWDLARTMGSRHEKNTVEAGWVLDHQFMKLHMKDAAVPSKYEADIYIGYSNADARYVVHWIDVWGGHYSLRGYGVRDGDSVEFRFPDGEGTITFFNTFAYDRARDAWTMKLENGLKDGKRTPFATDRLTRLK
jgi:hypothetical protein